MEPLSASDHGLDESATESAAQLVMELVAKGTATKKVLHVQDYGGQEMFDLLRHMLEGTNRKAFLPLPLLPLLSHCHLSHLRSTKALCRRSSPSACHRSSPLRLPLLPTYCGMPLPLTLPKASPRGTAMRHT